MYGGSIFPRRATSTCPLALPPELDVGRFRRTCALRRPGGSVASTKRHSRSVSGPHAPLPRARLSSFPFALVLPATAASSCAREPPDQSRGFSARAESPERHLVESTRLRTNRSLTRAENAAHSLFDTRRVARRTSINSVVKANRRV